MMRWVQQDTFPTEDELFASGKPLSGKSSFKLLNPFCDAENFLKVSGRFPNFRLNFDKKHQIVLPPKSKITDMILEYFHKRYLHLGSQSLLYHTRQIFWPVNGKNLAKKKKPSSPKPNNGKSPI